MVDVEEVEEVEEVEVVEGMGVPSFLWVNSGSKEVTS
jgi:hypothetical protein